MSAASRTARSGLTARVGTALETASLDLGVDLSAPLAGMAGDRAYAEVPTPDGPLGVVLVGPGRLIGIGHPGVGHGHTATAGSSPPAGLRAIVAATPPRAGLVVVGASQVAASGDLAVTTATGDPDTDLRGTADLVRTAGAVTVVTEHVTDRGRPRITRVCETTPVARHVVRRIITDLAVFDVYPHGLVLVETVGATTVGELRETTDAPFAVAPGIATGPPTD